MSEPTLDFVIEKIAARISSAVLSSLAPHQFHAEGKLSYSEAEAAELLGIPRHVLKGVRVFPGGAVTESIKIGSSGIVHTMKSIYIKDKKKTPLRMEL